jgi:hypothetical protein
MTAEKIADAIVAGFPSRRVEDTPSA